MFLEYLSRSILVGLSYTIKDIYFNVYGFRDDPLEDLDLPREKLPWLSPIYTAVDLFTINQKRISEDCIMDYPSDRMTDFLVFLCGLMTNELNKQQSTKWLRAYYNLMEVPVGVLRYWMHKLVYTIEDSKDHRRLFRNSEDFNNIFLRILTAVFNTVRSLDLAEVIFV